MTCKLVKVKNIEILVPLRSDPTNRYSANFATSSGANPGITFHEEQDRGFVSQMTDRTLRNIRNTQSL